MDINLLDTRKRVEKCLSVVAVVCNGPVKPHFSPGPQE